MAVGMLNFNPDVVETKEFESVRIGSLENLLKLQFSVLLLITRYN